MKYAHGTLGLVLALSLLVSVTLHFCWSGAYVRTLPGDRVTYWIGPVSTTVPFAFWALVTLLVGWLGRKRPGHLSAVLCGYVAGWCAMTAFGLWIISLPGFYGRSSTMGIAVLLTPFLFAPLFPLFFVPAFLIAKGAWAWKHRRRQELGATAPHADGE